MNVLHKLHVKVSIKECPKTQRKDKQFWKMIICTSKKSEHVQLGAA